MLYDDLQKNYALNEPILISEIKLDGVSMNNIRQQVKRDLLSSCAEPVQVWDGSIDRESH